MIFQKAQRNPARYFWSFAVILVILSLVSVLPRISDSLRVDEPFSANMATLSWAAFFSIFLHDPATPFYYIVLKLWAFLFGDSELALRSLSSICFALTVFIAGVTTFKIGGISAGLAATILASMNNVGLVFATIARPYALLSLLTAVSTYLFFIIMGSIHRDSMSRRERMLLMIVFTAINVLGLVTHPIFIFYVIGCNVAALLKFRQSFWHVSFCNLVAVGLFLALWGTYFNRTLSLPAVSWMETPDYKDLIHAYLNLWGVKKTILLLVFILLVSIWNFKTVQNFILSRTGLISIVLLSMMGLLPFAVSQYQVVFNDSRTPTIFFPLACVFFGLLLAQFKNLWLTFGLLVLLFGYVVAVPFLARAGSEREASPKSSIQYAVANAKCGDIFVSGGLSINETSYYMRQFHAPDCIENKVFPASINDHPGWMDPPSLLDQHAQLAEEADALVNDLDRELGTEGRLWFFYETDAYRQTVLDILKEQLDEKMILTETREGFGSFFDKILVYIAKH